MSTLSNVTDGQLCDDSGVPGCAPKIVVQDNAAKTVTVSNPTNVVTQTGGARITTSPSNTQVVTPSQAPQVVVNSSASTIINTGCCSGGGGSAEVGGADTQIQFNDAGLLAGDPTLTFDKTTDELGVQRVRFLQPVQTSTMLEVNDPGIDDPANSWNFNTTATYGDGNFTVNLDDGWETRYGPAAHTNTSPLTTFHGSSAVFRAIGSRTGDAYLRAGIGYSASIMSYGDGAWEGTIELPYGTFSTYFGIAVFGSLGDVTIDSWTVEMIGPKPPAITAIEADGVLSIDMPDIEQDKRKVLVVAESQVVDDTVTFGDIVQARGGLRSQLDFGPTPAYPDDEYGFSAQWDRANVRNYTFHGVNSEDSNVGFNLSAGVYVHHSTYNGSTEEGTLEHARLWPSGLSFATHTSDITIVPNGDMVGSINVEWPALSGTLARIEDIPGAGANNVNSITAVDGLLTLDFAEKAKEVFIVRVNQDITDVAFTNLPSDDYLELEIHFYQYSPGGYTLTLSNRFGKLSGSDADLQAATLTYTILKASSVTGGYNWRYTLNASTAAALPPE